jgi:hypothetical protein
MSDDRPTRESMSLEEATISSMWEIDAMVEVLERKGLCTKQARYDVIAEFRRKNSLFAFAARYADNGTVTLVGTIV